LLISRIVCHSDAPHPAALLRLRCRRRAACRKARLDKASW
jgi:hypothetical protein